MKETCLDLRVPYSLLAFWSWENLSLSHSDRSHVYVYTWLRSYILLQISRTPPDTIHFSCMTLVSLSELNVSTWQTRKENSSDSLLRCTITELNVSTSQTRKENSSDSLLRCIIIIGKNIIHNSHMKYTGRPVQKISTQILPSAFRPQIFSSSCRFCRSVIVIFSHWCRVYSVATLTFVTNIRIAPSVI
jgi:hypothetical protein